MNEILIILEAIVIFSTILLSKKLFGKNGLFACAAIFPIIANLIVAKTITVFGLTVSCAIVTFASIFLITDTLNENYGKEAAKIGVNISLFSNLVFIMATKFTMLFIPSSLDFINESMNILFTSTIRMTIASIVMFFLSNLLSVYIFDSLKRKTKSKHLWLRNNISTIFCNCFENFLFIFLAFYGIYAVKDMLVIAASQTVIEILIALLDTPFLYLSKRIKSKGDK